MTSYSTNTGKEKIQCPRCKNTEFIEHDCGSDTYEDDIFYISESCIRCGLWHSGWFDKWLIDVTNWRDEEEAEEFFIKKKKNET